MKQTSGPVRKKDIRRATRRQFSSEEKIRIVLKADTLLNIADCLKSFDDGHAL